MFVDPVVAQTQEAPALKKGIVLAALACLSWPTSAASQEGTPVDSLRLEIERLRATVDSLAALVEGLTAEQAGGAETLERLRAAALEAARAGEEEGEEEPGPPQFVGRQRSLQALNPEISVTADLLGLVAEGQPDEDNFLAREFEFSFQSALDPYSRAKIFIAHHIEGGADLEPFEEPGGGSDGHGGLAGETEIEEGYVEWVGLPWGLGLTLGRFRQRLGSYNRWHAHSLPGQSYFLPYRVFFGDEGLAQTGVSVRWLAPMEGAGTYEGWFEVTRSANPFFGESRRPSYLAHVNAFWDLSPSTYVEVGVSGVTGTFLDEGGSALRNRLLHVEAGVNWRPPERALYREVNLRAAIMVNERQGPSGVGRTGSALGGFALADARLGRRWWIGGRFDYVENPLDLVESAWQLSPTLTWWQSEWVRIRAEYDLLDGKRGRSGLFMIQTTISMGPHKHETY